MSAPSTWMTLRLDEPSPPALPGDGDVTVAVVASAETAASGWAARAAVALARAWATGGQDTYLGDLDLEAPALHGLLGLPDDEGLSDCLSYGASIRRIARPVAERLYVASAGTVSADPAALLASPRWGALVDAFHEAGALLVLYVPEHAAGAEAVLARADAVIVLRQADETVDLGEARERFVAAFGPAADDVGELGRVGEVAAEDAGDAGGALAAVGIDDAPPVAPAPPTDDEATSPPAPAAASGPGAEASADVGASPEPSPDRAAERSATGERRGGFRWALVLAVVVVLILALAVAMGWLNLPGLGPRAASATQVPAGGHPAPVPSAMAAPDPHDAPPAMQETDATLQAWALTLEAHQDAAAAYARVRSLGERWPDLLFWLAPVRVRDERFYRVLAGPATSRDEVEALRARLGGEAAWIAREAGWAFRLGAMAEYATARTWTEVLEEMDIPTHVLALSAADGSRTYQVYAGAYASSDEAVELADMLREQDLGSAPFVERRGTKPE